MKTLVMSLTTLTQLLAVVRSAIRKLRTPGLLAIAAFAVFCLLGGAQSLAQNAYIPNSNNVSVIDTGKNVVIATIPVGIGPGGVAVTSDGSKVYVANGAYGGPGSVSVIDTSSNTVIATLPVGDGPVAVAVTPTAVRSMFQTSKPTITLAASR